MKYAPSESFTHRGERHVARLGKNISRAVAGELARVQRGAILKGGAGIGGPKRADLTIEKAAEEFLAGTKANKRLRTQRTYGQCVERYTHLSPTHKAEAVERIARNSPTVFTTALKPRRLVTRKPAESLDAPVAQVDRAAVS